MAPQINHPRPYYPVVHRLARGRWTTLLWGFAAVATAAIVYRARLLYFHPADDDAYLAANAMRVAEGALPYRDYFLNQMPAGDFLYGFWFKAVGASFLTVRALTGVALLGATTLLYSIGRAVLPAAWAASAAAIWAAWSALFNYVGSYHFWAVLMILAMTGALLRSTRSRTPLRWCATAGLFAGVGVLFMQSMGAAALGGFFALLLTRRGWRAVLYFVGGGTVVAIALLAWLLGNGILSEFFQQAVVFVQKNYVPTHLYPFPWLPTAYVVFPGDAATAGGTQLFWLLRTFFWFAAYVAPLTLPAVILLRSVLGSGRFQVRREFITLATVAVGLYVPVLLFLWAPHAWINASLTLVLLIFVGRKVMIRLQRRTRRVALTLVAAGISILLLFPASLGWLERRVNGPYVLVNANRAAVLVHRQQAATVRGILRFARDHPGDRMAFLPLLQGFYILSGRPPSTSQVLILPGYNTHGQVREVERELVGRNVRWLLYFAVPEGLLTVNLPGAAVRARENPWSFDEFLAREYEPRRLMGEILALGPVTLYELGSAPTDTAKDL